MCKVTEMKLNGRSFKAADIKQKYIANVVDAAGKCELIDRIMLFGSSTESRCTEESDIDLAIFGNRSEYKALRSKQYDRFTDQIYKFDDSGQAYDLLYFESGKQYRNGIMDDVQNGELIYARN